eukprot:Skav215307  [mRNA]  locus=scaffold2444:30716:31591:+ [translate_table: standard]
MGGGPSKENPWGPEGWTPDKLGSLADKTYVISRTTTGCGEKFGADAKVSFVMLDLASLISVREAAKAVLVQAPKIDALICNAAIAQVSTQKLTVDGFESQLGVNHFAHFLLCGLLYDRVVHSKGRIEVVGTNGYNMGLKKMNFEDLNFDENYRDFTVYSQSKLAQVIFAYELQRRQVRSRFRFTIGLPHWRRMM